MWVWSVHFGQSMRLIQSIAQQIKPFCPFSPSIRPSLLSSHRAGFCGLFLVPWHTLFKHLKFHHTTCFVRGVRSGLKNTHASQWSKNKLCFRDIVEVHVLSVWTEKQNFESLTVQFVAVFVGSLLCITKIFCDASSRSEHILFDNHSLVLDEYIALNLQRSTTFAIITVVWWLQLYSCIKKGWLVLASGLCGFPKKHRTG